MKIRAAQVLLASALTALAIGAPLPADDDFHLWADPIELEILSTSQNGNSAKFQEYRDLGSGFRIPRLRLRGEYDGGDRWFAFRGDNVDRRDARYFLEYVHSGSYEVTFDYNRIPHRFGNDATFIYGSPSDGLFEVPAVVGSQLMRVVRHECALIRTRFPHDTEEIRSRVALDIEFDT